MDSSKALHKAKWPTRLKHSNSKTFDHVLPPLELIKKSSVSIEMLRRNTEDITSRQEPWSPTKPVPPDSLFKPNNQSERKAVWNLSSRVERQLEQAYASSRHNPEELVKTIIPVCDEALAELVSQTTKVCKERGQLFEKVLHMYRSMFAAVQRTAQTKLVVEAERHHKEVKEVTASREKEVNKAWYEVVALEKELESLKAKYQSKKDALRAKKEREKELINAKSLLQSHYKAVKQEVFNLKEDKSILEKKLASCHFEVHEDKRGYFVPKPRAELRHRHKTQNFFSEVISNDPFLQPVYPENIAALSHDFGINTVIEVADASEDPMELSLKDAAVMTNIAERYAGSRRKSIQPVRDLFKHATEQPSLHRGIRRSNSITKIIELELSPIPSEREMDPSTLKELVKKHRAVKHSFESMYREVEAFLNYGNIPHRQILNIVKQNLEKILEQVNAHPIETKEISDSDEDEQQVAERQTHLISYVKSVEAAPQTDYVQDRVQAIGGTPMQKIKLVLTKKTLLANISEIYLCPDLSEAFAEYVYQYAAKGLKSKKMINSRFDTILRSGMKYKYLCRVRVFGRLLGLYSPFDRAECKYFFQCWEFLVNSPSGKSFKNSAQADEYYVPVVRCEELIRNLHSELSVTDIGTLERKLHYLKGKAHKKGGISTDDFLEVVVSQYSYRRTKNMKFLRCIFEASDLNNDGHLELQEFSLLVKHIADRQYKIGTVQEFFKAYCESFLTEEEALIEAVSLENLLAMNEKHEIFSEAGVKKFARVNNDQEALEQLERIENVQRTLDEIYWRLSQCPKWNGYMGDILNLLELLRIKITGKKNPFVYWIALRLFEEESKTALLEESLKAYLPIIAALAP